MFDEASSASTRGAFRRNRRRLARRKERIKIVKELFAEEINKIDNTFFERLEDSFYTIDDKRNNNVHNIFTKGYTDKEFYDEYPTIFHLRHALATEDKKFDIRMLYLSVAHIIKYRGNFLYTGDDFDINDTSIVSDFFETFNSVLIDLSNYFEKEDELYSEKYFKTINLNNEFYNKLKDVLVNTNGITNKKNKLLELFCVDKKSIYNELVIPLLSNTKVNISNLSIVKTKKYAKQEIEFNEQLEEEIETSKVLIPELKDILEIIPMLKSVADYYFVNKVLGNSTSISSAMIKIYDKHAIDLKKLKNVIKKYLPNKYNEIFRKQDSKINNYVHYVGFNSINDKVTRVSHCSKEEFYDYLKKIINQIGKEDNSIDEILKDIQNGDFLNRQNSNQNGAFPMQLHFKELKDILTNQSKYYPFLTVKENGYSVIDKILLTFKYKLPYYVGPLNKKSNNSWVVRTNEKILPWNFDKVVNLDETAEEFIRRMQNKCTYLKGDMDYCLPKFSILFSYYNCLSYLNKITINGEYLKKDLKNIIINDLFLVKKQPTKKDIINYIESCKGAVVLTTTGKELPEVNCNMSSYIKMKENFGSDFDIDFIENIINDITLFEDKDILERRLKNKYHLSKDIISKLKGLNYKGYGRLSRNLLNGIKISDKTTGEVKGTIIQIMGETNMNLQEILQYTNFNTMEMIDNHNDKNQIKNEDYTVEDYIEDNIIISPAFKRPLIQTYNIITEIEKIFNRPIDEYYVECTRSNTQKKQATKSRYEKIKDLFNNCKEIAIEFNIDLNRLSNELEEKKNALKVDKLYFYFTQLGKCMYSLDDIDIREIDNNYKYDIDHIYPQSIIKDDSLSNRVLVDKAKNSAKTDKFLFESGVLNPKAPRFFKKLLDLELISKEKYRRLTQKEIAPEELNGFVNRQLVCTNQAVKGIIQLLRSYHNVDNKNIIFSKGENVSDFRKKFNFIKSRTANNFHHAHDAYLNVIVGGVLNKYYNSRAFFKFVDIKRIQAEKESINPQKIFERDIVKAYDKVIWNKQLAIKQIKNDLYNRFDITETFRTYNPNEMLSKFTILPAGEGKVPVKTTNPRSDISKYGGINSHSYNKFIILKMKTKNGVKTILEAIPRMYSDSKELIDKYVNQIYSINKKFLSIEVVNYNIKVNCIIESEQKNYILRGRTNDRFIIRNMKDRFFSLSSMKTIKKIDKYFDNKKNNNLMPIISDKIIISPAKNDDCDEISISINELRFLLDEIYNLFTKEIYNYSIINSISSDIKKVIEQENTIFKYDIENYIILCNSLLKLLKTNENSVADLSCIGKPSNSGSLQINKKLDSGTKFICNSITGYYKKVIYEVE